MSTYRSLLVLFFLFTLILSVQAVTLNITVRDNTDFTPIKDAIIAVDGGFVGKSGTDGTYQFSHALNASFHLKVTRAGYVDWTDIVSQTLTSITVDMARKSQVVTISVYDRETLQPLVNAFVRVSGEGTSVSGETDAEGETQFNLVINRVYTIEISVPRYEPILKTVEVTSGEQIFQYWLYRNDLYIVQVIDALTKLPLSNVTIAVDSTTAGSTGPDGRFILYLEREKRYRINATFVDYETAILDTYLTNEDLFLTIPLAKAIYPISILVFDERKVPIEGASVSINGTIQGRTDEYGRLRLSTITAGTYLLEVKKEGYVSWQENRTITQHGEELVAILSFASIDITIRTEEADHTPLTGSVVTINGVTAGKTDDVGELRTRLKTSSSYNISATHEGYHPSSVLRDVPLGANPTVITLSMERELNIGLIVISLVGFVVLIAILLVARSLWLGRSKRPRRH